MAPRSIAPGTHNLSMYWAAETWCRRLGEISRTPFLWWTSCSRRDCRALEDKRHGARQNQTEVGKPRAEARDHLVGAASQVRLARRFGWRLRRPQCCFVAMFEPLPDLLHPTDDTLHKHTDTDTRGSSIFCLSTRCAVCWHIARTLVHAVRLQCELQ